jgi:2-oxo-4-hydroxy-4-carboxy--5-ureidoimidazoline (OHCU) decarboxylase
VDNLDGKMLVAIAANQRNYELIKAHPSFKNKPAATSIFAAMSTQLKFIVLSKMGDDCLPLYSDEDVNLAIAANESYRPEMGFDFIAWLNLCKRSELAKQEAFWTI